MRELPQRCLACADRAAGLLRRQLLRRRRRVSTSLAAGAGGASAAAVTAMATAVVTDCPFCASVGAIGLFASSPSGKCGRMVPQRARCSARPFDRTSSPDVAKVKKYRTSWQRRGSLKRGSGGGGRRRRAHRRRRRSFGRRQRRWRRPPRGRRRRRCCTAPPPRAARRVRWSMGRERRLNPPAVCLCRPISTAPRRPFLAVLLVPHLRPGVDVG